MPCVCRTSMRNRAPRNARSEVSRDQATAIEAAATHGHTHSTIVSYFDTTGNSIRRYAYQGSAAHNPGYHFSPDRRKPKVLKNRRRGVGSVRCILAVTNYSRTREPRGAAASGGRSVYEEVEGRTV